MLKISRTSLTITTILKSLKKKHSSHQLFLSNQNYDVSTLGQIKNAHSRFWKYLKKHNVSIDLSLSWDRILVMNSPAELNALSVSTDFGGKVFMALKIFCRHAGRSPVDSNIHVAISRLTWCRTSLNVERDREGVGVVISKKSFNSSSLVFFLAGSDASGIFSLSEIWDKDAAGQTDGLTKWYI